MIYENTLIHIPRLFFVYRNVYELFVFLESCFKPCSCVSNAFSTKVLTVYQDNQSVLFVWQYCVLNMNHHIAV